MDGAIAPYVLPQLPGPEQPTNSMKGKWKVGIHTVGLKFLASAQVYVNDQPTGMLFKDWMAHAPGGRWKNKTGHLLPGTSSFQESDARWANATIRVDEDNLVPVPLGFDMWMHFGDWRIRADRPGGFYRCHWHYSKASP